LGSILAQSVLLDEGLAAEELLCEKLLRNESCVNWLMVDAVEIAPVIYKPTPFRGWVIDFLL
jgi:hypothetical protein